MERTAVTYTMQSRAMQKMLNLDAEKALKPDPNDAAIEEAWIDTYAELFEHLFDHDPEFRELVMSENVDGVVRMLTSTAKPIAIPQPETALH